MNKLRAILLSACMGFACVPNVNADIFRYVDDSGTIHFSNIPTSNSNEKVVREKGPKPERPEKSSARARHARATASISPDTGRPADKATYTPPHDCHPLGGDVPYADLINAKCTKYGVDPSLVKSVIKAESNFNPSAVSPKGAKGLMQLMPSTAADMGVGNIFDPEQNIDGGVRYLRYLLDNFGGDVELSVAAYNCGQGKVIRNGNCVPNIPETKNYVRKVMRLTNNPVTGMSFSRPIYKIEMKDGSIMFTDSPSTNSGKVSIVN